MHPGLARDVLDDAVEVTVLGFFGGSIALALPGRPGGLLVRVETPDYEVAFAAGVVVPVGVEGAVAFAVGAGPEDGVEGGFEGGEEDEVVGPGVGGCGLEFRCGEGGAHV